jgi:ribosomal protein S18 acetylase RimI-like enzyme
MDIGRDDRIRMERAHVRAWPALRTADIDGWLWRSSGGGSQRANSVSTIDFTGNDPAAAIAEAEARYAAVNAPARFQTFDDTSPPELTMLLPERGYRESEATVTMFRRSAPASAAAGVEIRDSIWDGWRDLYLGQVTASRREVNALILDRIPAPKAFAAVRRGGRIVSTALCVVGPGCAVLECVATAPEARRQGAARAALDALADWAGEQAVDLTGLQVVASNQAAVSLYRNLGFVAGATNRFWVRT